MLGSMLPVFLFLACILGVAAALLVVAKLCNPGRPGRTKQMPYESGMDPVHDTRRRFTIRFHLVAIAFLVFDVELLFLFPWAVAAHRAPAAAAAMTAAQPAVAANPPALRGIDVAVANGWVGSRTTVFAAVMVFLLLMALGFVYDWRKGVFRWQ